MERMRIGGIHPYDKWKVVRMQGRVIMWEAPGGARYGVYLYPQPPIYIDERWLLWGRRESQEKAEQLFDQVLSVVE